MAISTIWRRSNVGKKKARPGYKLKIRWELLGLPSPELSESTTSIETMRKGVSSLARQGFEPGTRSRLTEQTVKGRRRSRKLGGSEVRRRGSTK